MRSDGFFFLHGRESVQCKGFSRFIGLAGGDAIRLRMADDMIQYLILDRRAPRCNMARYFVLVVEPSLFVAATLTREWGRIGQPGQRRIEIYDSYGQAAEQLEVWLKRKSRRGSVVRS